MDAKEAISGISADTPWGYSTTKLDASKNKRNRMRSSNKSTVSSSTVSSSMCECKNSRANNCSRIHGRYFRTSWLFMSSSIFSVGGKFADGLTNSLATPINY